RPFLDAESPFALRFDVPPPSVFSPVLPFPLSPEVLVVDGAVEGGFPASDVVSPAILAGTVRAVHDMLASPERGTAWRGVFGAFHAGSPWQRRGIYLFHGGDDAAHAALRARFLESGFLLPPDRGDPLILPGELSRGEEAKLALLLRCGPSPAP
ncbi:MAG: hypothetical protein LBS82_04895, partial [Spirochaetaceae bacterium]|nr:hypothetical protein [Spirochaetaceae bacterium]